MKIIRLLVLSLAVAFVTGCPKGPSKDFPGISNNRSLVSNINTYLATAQENYNNAVAADPPNEQLAHRIRNEAIFDVLAVIDDNYTDYISNIESRRSKTDFLFDVIDLGAGAATGISKGERPNQILGIAMTAFRGGRKSAELNFYKQQTTPILISKMDDNRSTVLADILERQDDPTSSYSLKAAIRDLVDYYNGGTLVRAFTELSKATAVQAQASQTRVQNVRRLKGPLTVSAIPTVPLTQVLQLIEKQKISLAKQVDDAITNNPLAPPGALPAAVAAAQAKQTQALQPVRLKLNLIWKKIESNGKFAAAIAALNAKPADALIIANIRATPPLVTPPATVIEDNYLTLINDLQTELRMDVDLNRELLAILTVVNP
jgi:hypothetical protein